ncbi:DUF2147 domain-containing protein [Sphingomonas montanisoli]|uniref:DUF2147 domain-containing protein n=1 Tax=Sphingomonas montanisoli TaxID=2606412 RepID=A0A5D9CCL4_9SPHN|nr:DUF2147 domain-containing protein [Sphingomonas montanisoli]TZG29419.1 DUF2147 domain-containing protein [Sphingomonas montanisoli]
MSKSKLLIASCVLLFTVSAQAAAPITGNWITDGGKNSVSITKCGAALCGKIVKVLKTKPGEPSYPGALLLSELVDSGGMWTGKIHNPGSGKTYKAKVKINPDRTLSVSGCVAMFCKDMIWTPGA